MEDEICKIKCISCSRSIFEFSYNIVEISKKTHFYCSYCGDTTSVFINKEKELEIIKRGY